MSLQLIDQDGEVWSGGSHELRHIYDSPHASGEFSKYAVVNLGFIAVDRFARSCQVRLRPSMVSSPALASLEAWLRFKQVERLALSWFDTTWHYEIHVSPAAGIQRVEELARNYGRRPEMFLSRPRAPKDLRTNPDLGAILATWSAIDGASFQSALTSLIRRTLGERYVVIRPNPDKSKLVFAEIGEDMYKRYLPWNERPIGMPFENQPDTEYGRWANQCYEKAMRANRPVIEDVDAIVRWPGRGKSRLRYTRLLVPFRQTDAEPAVLGGTLIDNTLDLRVGS